MTADPAVMFCVTHSHAGGAQEIWSNLADAFRAAGHRTSLLALYPSGDAGGEAPGPGWAHLTRNRPRSALAAAALLPRLVTEIRNRKPAIIFAALPLANLLTPVAALLAGTGTRVVTAHHTDPRYYRRSLSLLDRLVGQSTSVQGIICVSRAVASAFGGHPRRYRAKLHVINNAIPPRMEAVLEQLAAGRITKARRQLVVCSGRLSLEKNYPVVIRAMRALSDLRLRIIGGGPEEASIRALAVREGVADRIEFVGQKSREEALRLLAEGDVFVQMSLFEGHSLGLIEAAKLGLPLIVSEIPAQVEAAMLKDGSACATFIPVHDDELLAAAIEPLMTDESAYQQAAHRASLLGASISFDEQFARYKALVEQAA